MHFALIEAVHTTYQSKKLIRIIYHLGLCTRYDEVGRIDTGLVQHTMDMTGSQRVPVLLSIVLLELVHTSMVNFDFKENAVFGIAGSHDTTLVISKH